MLQLLMETIEATTIVLLAFICYIHSKKIEELKMYIQLLNEKIKHLEKETNKND